MATKGNATESNGRDKTTATAGVEQLRKSEMMAHLLHAVDQVQ